MAQRIKYKVTNIDKLKAQFPEVVAEEQVVRNVIDKEKLYKIVKTMHSIGRSIDGVEIEGDEAPADVAGIDQPANDEYDQEETE